MRIAPTLLCLSLFGCAPQQLVVLSSTELGPLPTNTAIRGRDGGWSAAWQGRSIWMYGDTILASPGEDGSASRSNTMSWTEALDADVAAGIGGFTEQVDALGAPFEILPVTAAEVDYNAAHAGPGCVAPDADPCGSSHVLWPGPLVADPDRDRALAFWWAMHIEPGSVQGRGMGIAEWTDPDAQPVRPILDPDAADPTLLFPADSLTPANGAVLDGNWLFAFACPGAVDKRCRLGRVRAEDALEHDAWQWYRGLGDWSYDPANASALFEGSDMMSVHRSPSLNRWLVIYSKPMANRVVARTAEALEGPWSDEVELFRTVAPTEADTWSYAGLGHAEFADGGLEYVTYYRATGVWSGEVRQVQVELDMAAAGAQ